MRVFGYSPEAIKKEFHQPDRGDSIPSRLQSNGNGILADGKILRTQAANLFPDHSELREALSGLQINDNSTRPLGIHKSLKSVLSLGAAIYFSLDSSDKKIYLNCQVSVFYRGSTGPSGPANLNLLCFTLFFHPDPRPKQDANSELFKSKEWIEFHAGLFKLLRAFCTIYQGKFTIPSLACYLAMKINEKCSPLKLAGIHPVLFDITKGGRAEDHVLAAFEIIDSKLFDIQNVHLYFNEINKYGIFEEALGDLPKDQRKFIDEFFEKIPGIKNSTLGIFKELKWDETKELWFKREQTLHYLRRIKELTEDFGLVTRLSAVEKKIKTFSQSETETLFHALYLIADWQDQYAKKIEAPLIPDWEYRASPNKVEEDLDDKASAYVEFLEKYERYLSLSPSLFVVLMQLWAVIKLYDAAAPGPAQDDLNLVLIKIYLNEHEKSQESKESWLTRIKKIIELYKDKIKQPARDQLAAFKKDLDSELRSQQSAHAAL